MDRFRIEGGRRLRGTVRISGAKNAALPAMTAALLTAEPVHLHNIPRVRDISTMGRLARAHECARRNGGAAAHRSHYYRGENIGRRRALRTRAHDARLDPHAGALDCAPRRGARLLAGRMRDWRTPGEPARESACADGRCDYHRARLRRSARTPRAAARRAHRLRENHGYRHGKYSDGRHHGRWRNAPGQCRARARSHRPRQLADKNGSADRGRRHLLPAHSTESSGCTALPTP